MFLNIISIFFLFVAGIGLALASAYFGIHGFLDSFPLPEFFYGILYLGIMLEIAKNVTAIFLFHKTGDAKFPVLIKFYMWIGLIMTMVLSAYFTYAHLSVPMANYGNTSIVNTERIQFIESRISELNTERLDLNRQVSQLPENYVTARRDLLNSFTPRLNEITTEERDLREKLNELRNINVEDVEDPFAFTNYMGRTFDVDGAMVYNIIIILLVLIIDPMALMLTISATYLVKQAMDHRKSKEILNTVNESIEEKLTDYLDTLDYNIYHTSFNKNIYPESYSMNISYNLCILTDEKISSIRKGLLDAVIKKNIEHTHKSSGRIIFTSIKKDSINI